MRHLLSSFVQGGIQANQVPQGSGSARNAWENCAAGSARNGKAALFAACWLLYNPPRGRMPAGS
jgi:hypothetical protein